MTTARYIVAIIIGLEIASVMNLIFARTIENARYRKIVKMLSFLLSVLICMLFAFSMEIKSYASKALDFAILNAENKIKEFSPELLSLEYDASSINELTDKIANIESEIPNLTNSDEGKILEQIFIDSFVSKITGNAETLTNSLSYFQTENGKISVDSFFQSVKIIMIKEISPYLVIFKILVIILFVAYFIIYACISLYFKGGKKMYNNSIQFGEETASVGMENKF